jgi:protein TonB
MFGSSLFALQTRKGRSRFWFILPLSIVVHMVAFAGFVGAQYWAVPAVAEPELATVFVSISPPPAAAPAGHTQSVKPTVKPVVREVPVVRQPDPKADPTPAPLPPADTPAADSPNPGVNPGLPGGTDPNSTWIGPPGIGDVTNVAPIAEPVAQEGPLTVGGAVIKPEIIPGTRIKPSYTENARRAHVQGMVLLEAVIDAGGNVTGVKIVKPLTMGLDQEAVRAVRQWKFRPATLHGQPVAVFFQLAVTFEVAS